MTSVGWKIITGFPANLTEVCYKHISHIRMHERRSYDNGFLDSSFMLGKELITLQKVITHDN